MRSTRQVSTGCAGTPKLCTPLWTATTGGSVSAPAVVNGVVYVGSDDRKLYAFDAAGVTGCSGAPKSCTPLWTATTVGRVESAPTVVNGVVYVGAGVHDAASALYAFDAAGVTGCAGTPKTCAPLWKTTIGGAPVWSSPTVVNGVVYVGYGGGFFAFDAASGAGPMWTGSSRKHGPLVAGGRARDRLHQLRPRPVRVRRGRSDGLLSDDPQAVYAVVEHRTGLWLRWLVASGRERGRLRRRRQLAVRGRCCLRCAALERQHRRHAELGLHGPVACGRERVVYVGDDNLLYAFDAAGVTGCSGSPPKTCAPLRTAGTATDFVAENDSSPTVANGVVYLSSSGYHDLSDLGGGGTLNAYSLP